MKWLIKNSFLFSFKPKSFNQKDAIKFLNSFHERYPDAKAERSIEEALRSERKKDYDEYVKAVSPTGLGDVYFRQMLAGRYKIRNNEAVAYINDIWREFNGETITTKKAVGNSKSSELTTENIQSKYEELMSMRESLNEQYEERLDEINRQISIIDDAIKAYTVMIERVREKEKELTFCDLIQTDSVAEEEEENE